MTRKQAAEILNCSPDDPQARIQNRFEVKLAAAASGRDKARIQRAYDKLFPKEKSSLVSDKLRQKEAFSQVPTSTKKRRGPRPQLILGLLLLLLVLLGGWMFWPSPLGDLTTKGVVEKPSLPLTGPLPSGVMEVDLKEVCPNLADAAMIAAEVRSRFQTFNDYRAILADPTVDWEKKRKYKSKLIDGLFEHSTSRIQFIPSAKNPCYVEDSIAGYANRLIQKAIEQNVTVKFLVDSVVIQRVYVDSTGDTLVVGQYQMTYQKTKELAELWEEGEPKPEQVLYIDRNLRRFLIKVTQKLCQEKDGSITRCCRLQLRHIEAKTIQLPGEDPIPTSGPCEIY